MDGCVAACEATVAAQFDVSRRWGQELLAVIQNREIPSEEIGMKEQKHMPYAHLRSFVAISGAISALTFGTSAWAANDLAHKAEARGFDTKNMELVGWNDAQGRVIYQTSIATQNSANGSRVIAYAGHFSAKMLTPMTGQIEVNGTSIIDVPDPTNPTY